MTKWQALVSSVRLEFPKFKIVHKSESYFMKLLDVGLRIVTLNFQKKFMTQFVTTIGSTMYVHSGWEDLAEADRIIILRHERMHLLQSQKYGTFLYSFLYLCFPLPFGLAYYRAKFEKEAYEESLRAVLQLVPEARFIVKMPSYRKRYIQYFTTGQYAWMWPFESSIAKWYDETVERLIKEVGNENRRVQRQAS